ncbi:hypothetical protein F4775DRAFT_350301 [Biscogniauxia sp. FL1348]|nr:hypothetical protein F4775DRAFT_350301 [Biscogniauxia sp. FL1348]
MSIKHLPEHVIAQIKSSTTITSLNGVVCGLVRNALDANATKISISLDYARGNCSTEDNGLGIPPDEFKPGGGLGKLHYTSKFPPQDGIHGKYGTFIASLASLSLLTITSHHHGHNSHNSIRIHNSDILARHTPSPPEQRLLSFDHGTRVTIRDLFGSMPVRAKQRAIDAERGIHSKEWDSLKRALVALVLAWPGGVSLSIRESANRWSASIRSAEASRPHPQSKGDDQDLSVRTSRIIYQGQLFDDNSPETWVPLKASASSVSISGAVSLIPVATRRVQFISIGVQPVPNEHGSNVLYQEINRVFANSSFGVEEQGSDMDEEEQRRRARDRRYKTDGFTSQELKGRKGVDHWPMFYIKINLEQQTSPLTGRNVDEVLDDRLGSLNEIIDLLKAVVYEFLKRHHFRPKHSRPSKRGALGQSSSRGTPTVLSRTSSPRAAGRDRFPVDNQSIGDLASTRLRIYSNLDAKSRPGSPFDLWTRVKSGKVDATSADDKNTQEVMESNYFTHRSREASTDSRDRNQISPTPLFGPGGRLLRAPFSDIEELDTCSGPSPRSFDRLQGQQCDDILWTNPTTTETSIIDPRTGFVVQAPTILGSQDKHDAPSVKRLRLQDQPASTEEDTNAWAKELLSSWENPVFPIAEPQIPLVFDETTILGLTIGDPKKKLHGCHAIPGDISAASCSMQGRVSKEALQSAEVIAQVDRKFILVKVPLFGPNGRERITSCSSASLLVVIDQHAADERCRVEALMKDYFEAGDPSKMEDIPHSSSHQKVFRARMEVLDKPIRFDISARDANQFERSMAHFEYWGIGYDISPPSQANAGNPHQLKVSRLPPAISERCRLEPRLLIELLRREAWKLHENGNGITCTPTTYTGNLEDEEAATGSSWLAGFHGCPQGILDMINSRACRSSIMFNDVLSQEECVGLLRRLGDCAFPFQCAHGRPSMVPLVDLGHYYIEGVDQSKSGGGGTSFGREFRRWKTGDSRI